MGLLLGFSSSRAPNGNRETTTTIAAASPIRPRSCPSALALAHSDRDVLGLENAGLLEVHTASVEPSNYVFGLTRPRVRGPFSRRTVSVREEAPDQLLSRRGKGASCVHGNLGSSVCTRRTRSIACCSTTTVPAGNERPTPGVSGSRATSKFSIGAQDPPLTLCSEGYVLQ